MSLKMRYDREDNVLMIWLTEDKQVDHAEQSRNAIIHLAEDGEPVLLEILEAREFILELIQTAIPAASVEL